MFVEVLQYLVEKIERVYECQPGVRKDRSGLSVVMAPNRRHPQSLQQPVSVAQKDLSVPK